METPNQDDGSRPTIGTNPDRLVVIQNPDDPTSLESIVQSLRLDNVALIKNVTPDNADRIIGAVAERLDLRDQLEVQAGFASIQGHRTRVGQYFMSVNDRSDFQFIPPHSEGDDHSNMQLAAFYCYENTTDGGLNIFMNLDQDSPHWADFREYCLKIELLGRSLSSAEVAEARMLYGIRIPEDVLKEGDSVLSEIESPIVGTKLFEALKKPGKAFSKIKGIDVNVYWDSIASSDFDSGVEFMNLLQALDLLKVPPHGIDISQLDNAHDRRIMKSGVRFPLLFKAMIVRKLQPGELIIQNNSTWAHSTSNWTPDSGIRKVVASFA